MRAKTWGMVGWLEPGLHVNVRRRIILTVGAFSLTAQMFVFWLFWESSAVSRDFSEVLGNAERGAYIAQISGCTACHTNRENGGDFLAGGAAMRTAMGVFFPPNITSDKNAGIGLWDLKSFANAVTLGVAPDGSHYYPVFPYWSYASLTDQDVADLWAAFKTTTPSATPSIGNKAVFPANDRRLLSAWKRFGEEMTRFRTRPDRPEEWNRGAYLAMGPGQCMSCHRRGNFFEKLKWRAISDSTVDKFLTDFAPELSAESLKAANWSKQDIIAALRSGKKPSGESFSGAMSEAVINTTSLMSQSDLSALATYLLWQSE